MIKYVLFDLDETLYPPGAGRMQAISSRINADLIAHLGLTPAAAEALRRDYERRYGSFFRGMALNGGLDPGDLSAYAHDVHIEQYLAPDPDLGCLIECIQSPRVIFTNAPHAYAERVLTQLDISRQFARLFAYEFGEGIGKLIAAVYTKVQRALHVTSAGLVMVDDVLSSLAPAHALGWKTIWVNPNGAENPNDQVDFVVHDMWQIAGAFHRLGVMDSRHRLMADHRLAGCVWVQRHQVRT